MVGRRVVEFCRKAARLRRSAEGSRHRRPKRRHRRGGGTDEAADADAAYAAGEILKAAVIAPVKARRGLDASRASGH